MPQPATQKHDAANLHMERFSITARLGSGGVGEVFLAEDRVLKRRVAIKAIRGEQSRNTVFRQRLRKEAERASQLNNEHIAKIHDLVEENGRLFLVMEYVEGETLRSRLRQPLTEDGFFSLAEQFLEGVAAAHRRGILHCDLKPDNVMITPEGVVKILDFGFARHTPSPSAETRDSLNTATLGGTPGYIAPEVLLGSEPDQRADIFSAGIMLYQALAGRHPFRGEGRAANAGGIFDCQPPPLPSSAPTGMTVILERMLAKEPSQRYQCCGDALADVRALHARQSPVATITPGRKRLRRPAMAALGAVLSIGLLATTLRSWRPWSAAPVSAASRQVVVLPFQPASQEANSRAFANGLTETLAAKLEEIADRYPLEIVPAGEVRAQKVNDIKQARAILGATLVLEGSLQQSGSTVRVVYSLVDTRTLRQVNSGVITADASNPFAVQDRVIHDVLNNLDIELATEDRGRMGMHGTAQPRAYDFYLRGRGFLQNYDRAGSLDNAIAEFRGSLEFDPRFALAYAGLGQAYMYRYELTHLPESLNAANDACSRAVELESGSPDGEICLGMLFNATGRFDSAAQHLERALKLDSSRDETYRELAIAYEGEKRVGEAESLLKKAVALRPQTWSGYKALGWFYSAHGRYSDAVRQFKRVIDLAPDSIGGYSNLGAVYVQQGKYKEAIDALEQSIAIQPTAAALNNAGAAYFYQSRFQDAARSYELAAQMTPEDYTIFGNLGEVYAQMQWKQEDSRRNYARALQLAEQRLAASPADGDALMSAALYAAALGEANEAERYRRAGLKGGAQDPESRLSSALVFARLHQDSRAMAELERALLLGLPRSEVSDNPEWRRFAANPRYEAMMAQTRTK
jgi:serine/threonine protein kinase/tetratricopeptide (TPR) repeat protein